MFFCSSLPSPFASLLGKDSLNSQNRQHTFWKPRERVIGVEKTKGVHAIAGEALLVVLLKNEGKHLIRGM
jgi:hypothetical protein